MQQMCLIMVTWGMKLLLILKLVDSRQCWAVQLFPLQRCLDTSPREPGPEVISTVVYATKGLFQTETGLKIHFKAHWQF